jgi:hypothetical protein
MFKLQPEVVVDKMQEGVLLHKFCISSGKDASQKKQKKTKKKKIEEKKTDFRKATLQFSIHPPMAVHHLRCCFGGTVYGGIWLLMRL